jgi:hypothetical protein
MATSSISMLTARIDFISKPADDIGATQLGVNSTASAIGRGLVGQRPRDSGYWNSFAILDDKCGPAAVAAA